MHITPPRTAALGFALLAALSAGGALAQSQPSQPAQARVIAATPMTEAGGRTSYNVTYEYAGRQYTTRTDTPPGATVPIEVNAYGVATLPVAPQGQLAPERYEQRDERVAWQNVMPEPGVVVSPGVQPAVTYAPAPTYYYAAPAPVYVQPAYAYPAPYAYAPAYFPPVGLSLNLGYSRGWGGHRGWR